MPQYLSTHYYLDFELWYRVVITIEKSQQLSQKSEKHNTLYFVCSSYTTLAMLFPFWQVLFSQSNSNSDMTILSEKIAFKQAVSLQQIGKQRRDNVYRCTMLGDSFLFNVLFVKAK